jgi:hypothetical protein
VENFWQLIDSGRDKSQHAASDPPQRGTRQSQSWKRSPDLRQQETAQDARDGLECPCPGRQNMAVPASKASAPKIPKALHFPIEALAYLIPRALTAPPSGEGRNFRPAILVASLRTCWKQSGM